MFSPIGAPNEDDQEIDWLSDLKFFIDNDNRMLSQYMFPAIKRHKDYVGNPNVYKVYIRPLESCLEQYCNKFEIENPEEKFPKKSLIELAKKIAEEQEKHINSGSYENL